MITVGSVFDDNREALSLDWIAGRSGAEKPLTGRDAGSVALEEIQIYPGGKIFEMSL